MTDQEVVARVRLAQLEDQIAAAYRWQRVKTWAWPVVTLLIVGAALWEILAW